MKKLDLSGLLLAGVVLMACCGGSAVAAGKARTTVLDGRVSIELPDGYTRMSDSMIAKKYPQAAQRPGEAWFVESEHGNVSMAFSLTQNRISASQLPDFAGVMEEQLSVYSPEVSEVTVNGEKMVRIELTTPDQNDPEGGIHNVMQLSSVDGRLMIATFNSTSALEERYLPAGKASLATLKY